MGVVSLQQYDLGDKVWLKGLYEERLFWVSIYIRNIFQASISTTQRIESINVFLQVRAFWMLKKFVDQYENAFEKKVEIKTIVDFNSYN